ncbi:hypothetical protein K438DRAFT_2027030, partial [Mycena galopus ATCC 62051]
LRASPCIGRGRRPRRRPPSNLGYTEETGPLSCPPLPRLRASPCIGRSRRPRCRPPSNLGYAEKTARSPLTSPAATTAGVTLYRPRSPSPTSTSFLFRLYRRNSRVPSHVPRCHDCGRYPVSAAVAVPDVDLLPIWPTQKKVPSHVPRCHDCGRHPVPVAVAIPDVDLLPIWPTQKKVPSHFPRCHDCGR